jgi:hypothetical protein
MMALNSIRWRLFTTLLIMPHVFWGQDSSSITKVKFQKNIFISSGAGIANFYNSNLWDNTINQGDFNGYPMPLTGPYNHNYRANPIGKQPTSFFKNKAQNISTGIEFNKGNNKTIKFSNLAEINFNFQESVIKYNANYSEDGAGYGTHNIDTTTIDIKHFMASLGYSLQASYKKIFISTGAFVSFTRLNVYRQTIEYSHHYEADPFPTTWESTQVLNPPYFAYNYLSYFFRVNVGRTIELRNFCLKPSFNFTSNILDGYNLYSVSLAATYKLKSKEKVTQKTFKDGTIKER